MPRILIVGGGYAGFYTARKLEKYLRKNEAEVTMIDPLPYMTYQPFLPEVAAGSIEPRHAVVSHRRHLKRTEIITGRVSHVGHKNKSVTIEVPDLPPYEREYDHVVVTAGAVSRTFPIPGVAEVAIGMKTIEEAIEIRHRILTNFDKAGNLPPRTRPPEAAEFCGCGRRLCRNRSFCRDAFACDLPPALLPNAEI